MEVSIDTLLCPLSGSQGIYGDRRVQGQAYYHFQEQDSWEFCYGKYLGMGENNWDQIKEAEIG